ncbi:MAG: GIY-YIG nuclease family protein [Armatimonadetes bacterium]|nr:GIY-YIG nuclease family protein [Armatimonadota bacterium]
MGQPFYAYMLLCADNSYYAGHTDDLEKRVAEHQAGGKCVYTAKRRPVRLVWSERFATRNEAKEAEARIKGWTRAKKEALARGEYEIIVQLARKQDWDAFRERQQTGTDSPEPAPRSSQP